MKLIATALFVSLFAIGSTTAPASASPVVPRSVAAPSAIENIYYYQGRNYPYRYHGHYYRYRNGGHYYNHRRRVNGHWRYY